MFRFVFSLVTRHLIRRCKFTAWCLDIVADKPHPRFHPKILSKKVWLIRRFLQYLFSVLQTWQYFVIVWGFFSSVVSFGVLGMTMVKFGKGEENSPVDFIAKRRAALERYRWLYCCANLGAFLCVSCKLVLSVVFSRYLNRVARHPVLREDPDFRQFLEADVVWTSCLSRLHVCTEFYILYMQLHGLVDQWWRWNVMLHISRSGGSLPAICHHIIPWLRNLTTYCHSLPRFIHINSNPVMVKHGSTLFFYKNSIFLTQARAFLFFCWFEAETFLWLFWSYREVSFSPR